MTTVVIFIGGGGDSLGFPYKLKVLAGEDFIIYLFPPLPPRFILIRCLGFHN